ncbi:MAG: dihydroxyacetone kinase subunit L [Caldilineaceae bacterium]|nr:dihydroxyacetone kinase subunit L [Caldilineaceae bacterium]
MMTTTLDTTQIKALMSAVADGLIAHKDDLAALDAELGDGDLGRTVERGFIGIKEALAGTLPDDIGRALFQLGKAFSNAAPSSFGALYGTALMKGGTALKDKLTVTLAECADATQAALDALIERGKAQVGDKTMLDAIAPAINAMRATLADVGDDASAAVVLRAAADAAQQGADETASMQSKIGRASWQGERSTGKKDPGAQAVAFMFAAAAAYLEAQP